MIERDPEAPATEAAAGHVSDGTRRARYRSPVLAHLGSVNRLTLSVSSQGRTDGFKHVKPPGQG